MQTDKLYNGKVNLYFDESKHVYSLDEKQEKIIPGVTSITSMVAKPALVPWAVKCTTDYIESNYSNFIRKSLDKSDLNDAQKLKVFLEMAKTANRTMSNEASTNGTKTHKWIENYIKGEKQTQPENPEIMGSCFAFLNWLREAKPEFIYTERPILSQKHGYAGTLDFTAKIDSLNCLAVHRMGLKNALMLGDFKTSKAIYPEYFMETAARVKALEEEFPDVKYDGMMIVRVGKDGVFSFIIENDIDKYFKAFLGAKQLYMTFKS